MKKIAVPFNRAFSCIDFRSRLEVIGDSARGNILFNPSQTSVMDVQHIDAGLYKVNVIFDRTDAG